MALRRYFGGVISNGRYGKRMVSGVRKRSDLDRIAKELMQKINLKKWEKMLDNCNSVC